MKKVLFILGELDDSDIDWMITKGRREKVPTGTILIKEGKPIDALYIILDGMFSISVEALGGREIARLGTGEMVGEMSFVEARPPSATVKALENALVLAIPRAQLTSKLEQDLGFAARFYKALAVFLSDRLRGTVGRLGYGGTQPLREDTEYEDELDPHILDNISLAGDRFHRMLQRLRGE